VCPFRASWRRTLEEGNRSRNRGGRPIAIVLVHEIQFCSARGVRRHPPAPWPPSCACDAPGKLPSVATTTSRKTRLFTRGTRLEKPPAIRKMLRAAGLLAPERKPGTEERIRCWSLARKGPTTSWRVHRSARTENGGGPGVRLRKSSSMVAKSCANRCAFVGPAGATDRNAASMSCNRDIRLGIALGRHRVGSVCAKGARQMW
jgi:hypothetical protein